jgi:hypothetical protein
MKTYAEAQFTIVRQIQAEHRAEAAANRIVTANDRRTARDGAEEGAGWFQRIATPFRVNRAART